MRMVIPPIKERKTIHKLLRSYFDTHDERHFKKAVRQFCSYFKLPKPKIEWYEYIDRGTTVGRCHENGLIHLTHPENWKKNRKYNTEKQWINAVYHELGHYLFYSDAEKKADMFALNMERGLNGNGSTKH